MYNKKENLPALRRTVCCLLLTSMLLAALLGFAMPTSAAGSDDTPRRTLRVGFYAYTGYHVMDEDGHRSGYSYEVLQRIAQHENVQFEYLAYDCDANEAADMLERGEIDLLPTLRKTDERAERFDFSNEPISNVATMLTVKAGNRSIVAGNYDTFDGMVVGMSRSGNGRNESFKAYAEKNGFTYTPVYFDTDEELSAALRSGTITAAVSNRMRQTSNEWVIDTFDNEDVYIAVRKGDASTLRLVNDALIRMDRDDPTWRTALFDKYNKNIHTSNKLYLTAAEENYITAHNAAGKEFTVLANPDRYPYSYLDKDGKLTGIMVDLFKLVAGRARLHYKFLTPADRTEYKQILNDRAADFVIDLTSDFSTAEDCGYKLTDSYLSAEFSWVLLRSDERRSFCIGVNRDYDVLLRSVLNKSVNSLTRAEVVSITNKYINLGTQKFSLVRLAYQYPPVIVLTYLCVVAAIVCIRLVLRSRRFRAEAEKALHKAEEASAAKTEFLSNMSHDIRTPINGIMGMLDIAEENFDDKARVKDCIAKMRGAASHLLSLVNDVLDMSKIESGSMQMLNTPFDLRVLLDSCCGILEGQITERNMTFTKQIGPFWHPYLVGSELHIRQVLINILSNAVKYTPDGGEINFRAKETLFEEGLVHLRMEIKDNGIGMSEEFMQHIFEPFTQEQRTSRTTYKGTGLGMAITKKLVDQMHGSLDVESEPGKGSTFILRLSLPVGECPANAPDPMEEKRAPDLKGLHLLLAEDNELNAEIAVTLLEEQGAKITAVTNGKEALETIQNAAPRTYDAILMDVMMPEMNGLEATRCIRAFEGKGPDEGTPIIAMTANVFADDVKACLDAGMNSHVGKPLDMKILMAEILKYTNRTRSIC